MRVTYVPKGEDSHETQVYTLKFKAHEPVELAEHHEWLGIKLRENPWFKVEGTTKAEEAAAAEELKPKVKRGK